MQLPAACICIHLILYSQHCCKWYNIGVFNKTEYLTEGHQIKVSNSHTPMVSLISTGFVANFALDYLCMTITEINQQILHLYRWPKARKKALALNF